MNSQPPLDTVLEVSRIPAGLIHVHQRFGIGIADRPAIGLPCQSSQNFSRTGHFIRGAGRFADEYLVAAGRVRSVFCRHRALK